MKRHLIWILGLVALTCVGMTGAAPAGASRGRMKGAVIFKLKAGADGAAVARLEKVLADYRFNLDKHNAKLGHYRVKTKQAGIPEEELATLIQASGAVEFAEPDYIAAPVFTPNDPNLFSQWFHAKIGSQQAWDNATGNDIVTAVCDTGVDPTHPDLQANLLPNLGWNTHLNNPEWSDIQGHGTSVAGCIAAVGNNALGVAGVAFHAKIIPIRICYDSTGYAYYSDMAEGIRYGTDQGAKVVNLSYGGWYGDAIRDACRYAWDRGTVVCIAAGNDGADQAAYAESDSMLLVGATDSGDNKASWSNYGVPVDFFAPGVSIYTTRNGGGYGSVSGTSFASPISAGLAALILGVNPALTPGEVEDIIMATCKDLGVPGEDAIYGAGRIDAAAAVALAADIGNNVAPVAVIAAPAQVDIHVAATFNGSGSYDVDGTVADYAWAFGDGSHGNGVVVSHAYAVPGPYTVTLTVTDDLAKTGSATAIVQVVDPSFIAAPTGLAGTAGKGTVTLRWTDNAANETGYYVERGTYNSKKKTYAWTRVATLGANTTTWSQAVAKGTWYYRVQACNTLLGKTSAYSNILKIAVK